MKYKRKRKRLAVVFLFAFLFASFFPSSLTFAATQGPNKAYFDDITKKTNDFFKKMYLLDPQKGIYWNKDPLNPEYYKKVTKTGVYPVQKTVKETVTKYKSVIKTRTDTVTKREAYQVPVEKTRTVVYYEWEWRKVGERAVWQTGRFCGSSTQDLINRYGYSFVMRWLSDFNNPDTGWENIGGHPIMYCKNVSYISHYEDLYDWVQVQKTRTETYIDYETRYRDVDVTVKVNYTVLEPYTETQTRTITEWQTTSYLDKEQYFPDVVVKRGGPNSKIYLTSMPDEYKNLSPTQAKQKASEELKKRQLSPTEHMLFGVGVDSNGQYIFWKDVISALIEKLIQNKLQVDFKNNYNQWLSKYYNEKTITGWKYEKGNWYYLEGSKGRAKGWRTIGGKKYYFNMSTGAMVTGWQTIDGKKYYFADTGEMLTGWFYDNGKLYYFNSDGVAVTGWQTIGGKKYYFNSSGVMVKGWQTISNKKYYFDENGVMQTGLKYLSGKWYYFDSNGVMKTGWQTINGKKYYFDSNGVMKTGWLTLDGKKYYLNKDGSMHKGWIQLSGKWYYFDSNGVMVTGWKKLNGIWYYFDKNGVNTKKQYYAP